MTGARVCVTGAGLVSALGATLAATHAALCAGVRDGYALTGLAGAPGVPLRGHPVAALDPAALAVGPGERRYMSGAMRLLQVATRAALDEAGLAGDRRRLASFGIALGAHAGERTSRDEIAALEHAVDARGHVDATRYGEALLRRAPLSALRAQPGLLAGMLALLHGVEGPCLTVIDDGVAGGRAVAEACQAIGDGWCDGWIAGAAFDLDDPWILLTRGRRSPSLGSAAAVLVLESETAAGRRGAFPRATLVLQEGHASSGQDEAGEVDEGFAALRITEGLGDTLAAAAPVALALGVHHVGAMGAAAAPGRDGGDAGRGASLRIAPARLGTAFLLVAAAPAAGAASAGRAGRSDGARAAAGTLGG